ncbi:LOW QUALITY PROTEIN: hypothetical protein BRADI_4g40371v3 [Brachypodium distachyon]|uniref:Strictosidine synthase conserved region domain-containing protein n=1 Tax=Brachypodium distachyon TaxID=15368 RepID=A0A2K2CTG5_BRADI|nr:LOW QUALITY PROTEIN: hypothetical protein BRADI_4g40371v3 [Brachypodium distachyon]
MASRSSTSTWLVLFVGLLAIFLAPSSASAAEIKTNPTEHGFRLPLPNGVTGAESLAFDTRGKGPYVGVSDGRVLRWGGSAVGWTTFAHHEDYRRIPLCTVPVAPSHETESICGRPLGLAFHRQSGDLYIADAYKGLLRIGSDGGEADVLATGVDGVPFRFVNGIDVDQATSDVYFTDSSLTYPRRFNTEIMMNADVTGRLLKYEARTKQVIVLKDGLPYPNGVAVSHDRTYVVVAHTVPCQAHRYYLQGAKYELMANLSGYPDNVRRDGKGGYWVALNQEKARPDMASMGPVKHLVGVRLDGNGVQVEELTAAKGVTLSEVSERSGRLWLGSVELDYIGLV